MSHAEEMMKTLEESSGGEFDQAFIKAMIMHHEQAIKMSEMAQEKAEMPDLKKMAQEMAEKQSKEVEALKAMQ